jgi:pyrroloquinoline quinone biosynthesis protein D
MMDSSAPAIPLDARPRLAPGVRLTESAAHGGTVLLAPERVFKADSIAKAVLERCTGALTLGDIVDDLARAYEAPHDRVLADVTALLSGLVEKRLIQL